MSDMIRQIRSLGAQGGGAPQAWAPTYPPKPYPYLEGQPQQQARPQLPVPFPEVEGQPAPAMPAPPQPAEPPPTLHPHSWLRAMEQQDQSLMPMPHDDRYDAPTDFGGEYNEYYNEPYFHQSWMSQRESQRPDQPYWSNFRKQYEKDKGIKAPKKPLRRSV